MQIVVMVLLAVIAAVIVAERRYFRAQREECRKYPFFRLRDGIVRAMISSSEPEKYLEVYDAVNGVIQHLRSFDFSFYSRAMAAALGHILEEAYRRRFKFDDQFMAELRRSMEEPFKREFMQSLLDAARENSLLLRLAMTRLGYRILFTRHFAAAFVRLMNRHPELYTRREGRLRTMGDYSLASYVAAHQ